MLTSNGSLLEASINNKILAKSSQIIIKSIKSYKVSDHGLKNGQLEVSLIDVNKYKTYISPDNK